MASNLNTLPEVTWIEPIPDEPRQRRRAIRPRWSVAARHDPPRVRGRAPASAGPPARGADPVRGPALEGQRGRGAARHERRRRSTARSSAPGRRSRSATSRPPTPWRRWTPSQRELLARYVDAFQRYDIDALTSLIREDASQSMPPYDMWLSRPRGRPHVVARPGHRVPAARGWSRSRRANGSVAFGQYKPSESGSGYDPWALQVLEIADGKIVEFTFFLVDRAAVPAVRAAAAARRLALDGIRLRPSRGSNPAARPRAP